MTLTHRLLRHTVAIALAGLACVGAIQAQTPVRVVVPAAPGSSADVLARLIGEKLAAVTSQPWVVDNRPGAGGIIGSDVVAKAPADGHTLLFTANNFIISPAMYPSVPYDVLKDFAPVGMATAAPNILFVNAATDVKTMADLVRLAKRTPGGINYGSPFVGTSAHLLMEMVKRAAGIEMLHIPARGTPQAFTEAIAGRVPLVVGNLSDGLPHVKAGTLRAIAVADERRLQQLPDVPTLREAGYPGLELPLWFALYAPAATPRPVVERLNRQLVQVLSDPEVVQALSSRGFEARPSSPQELAATMRRELPVYAKVVAEAGVKP